MISLIIPVCWGYKPFLNLLEGIVELPVIGEVILINNNKENTPSHEVLNHSKVKHHVMEENIFVNPAWNLGVQLAAYDNLCIMSDDVMVDLRVFMVADKLINKEVGVLSIGISRDLYNLQNNELENINVSNLNCTGDIKIKTMPGCEFCGAGSLFFIHKDNWIEIPSDFKIYFGDNWIQDMQTHFGRINYFINDCFYYSPWSAAVKIGISAEYQQTEEYRKNENSDNYNRLKQEYIKGKNHE